MTHLRIVDAFSPSPAETQIHYRLGSGQWWVVLVDNHPPYIERVDAA